MTHRTPEFNAQADRLRAALAVALDRAIEINLFDKNDIINEHFEADEWGLVIDGLDYDVQHKSCKDEVLKNLILDYKEEHRMLCAIYDAVMGDKG